MAVTQDLAELLSSFGVPEGTALVLSWTVAGLVLAGAVLGVGGIMSFIMRRTMARVQTRMGPNRVGPFGLLQFLADGVKMVSKEDFTPSRADPWLFKLAPYLVFLPIVLAFVPIPFAEGVLVADLRLGLIFIFAIGAIAPIGEIAAGWASNNKYATLGAMRAASMDVAYEIPLVIAAIAVAVLTGSLVNPATGELFNGFRTTDIALAQGSYVWFILLQPLGALIFFATALAKAGLIPTDLPEAESELVAGFFTEYSGMRYGVLFVGVFVNIVFVSAITVLLYFGGWTMPFVPDMGIISTILGLVFFIAKVAVFVWFVLLAWFTLPRWRTDQFLNMGWKILFPLALLNLVVTLVQIELIATPLFGGA